MILIPVKNLSSAKQRLAGVLDQTVRTELAHAMLRDVLSAVTRYGCEDACLVTSDPFARDEGAKLGVGVIRDEANTSETDAIEVATRICGARGVRRTLVIPGDIPLIEAEDLATIFEQAPDRGAVLVPSRDGRGTNAALRTPPNLFPLRFGNDSFQPHLQAAILSQGVCTVLSLARIGLDIDTVDDLENLAAHAGDKHAQELARKLGFGRAVPASIRALQGPRSTVVAE